MLTEQYDFTVGVNNIEGASSYDRYSTDPSENRVQKLTSKLMLINLEIPLSPSHNSLKSY